MRGTFREILGAYIGLYRRVTGFRVSKKLGVLVSGPLYGVRRILGWVYWISPLNYHIPNPKGVTFLGTATLGMIFVYRNFRVEGCGFRLTLRLGLVVVFLLLRALRFVFWVSVSVSASYVLGSWSLGF